MFTFAFPRWQTTQAALTCARLGLVTDELGSSWECGCDEGYGFASGVYRKELELVDSFLGSLVASLRGPMYRPSFAISL
jgi:hypothetical protein